MTLRPAYHNGMKPSRRDVLRGSAALGAVLGIGAPRPVEGAEEAVPAAIAALTPMTDGVSPITVDERRARIARAQALMAAEGLQALVLGVGDEPHVLHGRGVGRQRAVLRRRAHARGRSGLGDARLREGRARSSRSPIGHDVRAWEEDESPFALVASILRKRGVATGTVGHRRDDAVHVRARDRPRRSPPRASCPARPSPPGCRMIKDAHELALMRRANEITVRAHRAVFAVPARGHDPGGGVRPVRGGAPAARHARRLARPLRRRRRLPARDHAPAAAAPRRRRAHRRRRRPATATRATSRAPACSARRPPRGSARSGTSCAAPSRPPSTPRSRASRRRRWTPRRAA